MTTYRLSDTPSPQYSRLKWQLPLFTVGFVIAAIACSKVGIEWRELFPQAPDLPRAVSIFLVVGAVMSGGCLFFMRTYLRSRSAFVLRISPEGVFRHWPPLHDISIARIDILGFVERKPGRGFFIRSTNGRHAIGVPSELAGYEECQAELISSGIPKLPFDARRDVWPAVAPLIVLLVALAALSSSSHLEAIAGLAGFAGVFIWVGQRGGRLRDFSWWLTFALCALLLSSNHRVLGDVHSRLVSPLTLDLLILGVGLVALTWSLYEKWHKPKT